MLSETSNGFFSILITLVLMLGVVALSYYATKLVGRKYAGGAGGTRYIKVLERVALGQDKALVLVQIADQTLLLGVAGHSICKVSEIDPALLPDITQTQEMPFSSALTQALKNFKNGRGAPKEGESHDEHA